MWFRKRHTEKTTAHPPPVFKSVEQAQRVGAGLLERAAADPAAFVKTFTNPETAAAVAADADFAAAGLVSDDGTPRVRLFPFFEHLIATDLLSHEARDQVFSLMFEQVYLQRNARFFEGGDVLELCLGSGVNCVTAAARGARVTGVDISPRALAFARFNWQLNGIEGEPEFVQGSLFEPLGDRTFDAILINPPFEPAPPAAGHFLHSDGGADGLDIVRTCLERAPAHLNENGVFEIVTYSPGDAKTPLLLDLLRNAFPTGRIVAHLLNRTRLEGHLAPFRKAPGYREWCRGLGEAGLTHNHFLFCRVEPAVMPETETVTPVEEIDECNRICAAWN